MDNLITEFWKIKRYSVIKAGAAMMFLSVFMSYFYSTASTSVGWDFNYFVHQVVQQNCTYFFPVVIMLTASFVISRETMDDTLKSILTVPVDFKKLLIGKFELLFSLHSFQPYQRCARCYYESAPAFPRNVSIQHYDRHGADHSHKYFNLPFGTSTHYYQYISFWK